MNVLDNFIIKKKPTTASLRHVVLLNLHFLNKLKPLKSKNFKLKKTGGRNNKGRITAYRKGGGHKKIYRFIEYNTKFLEGIVESIEYDPNRTANIARIYSSKNEKHFYVIAPNKLKKGDYISSTLLNNNTTLKIGYSYALNELPIGSFVYNIKFLESGITGCARSAGCYGVLISKNKYFSRVRLPSGEHRLYMKNTFVSLGSVSNSYHKLTVLGKAGRSRWLGCRPSVRGVAMNPIDHPHGGGEGKTSGGRPSVTPWGKVARGQSTRKRILNSNIIRKKNV